MAAGEDGDTISDFTLGTDKLILTVTATGGMDLSSQTVTAGAYDLEGNGDFDVTLTGSTATDLSDSIQLGTSTTAAVAAGAAAAVTTYTSVVTGGATVGGDFADIIELGGAHSVTGGAGADIIISDIANTGSTVADFVMGTDTLILTGTATATLDLTAITPTAGLYDFGGNGVTLTGQTATDVSGSVVLGTAAAAFTIFATGSVTGGTGNDYIATQGSIETVNFIDNGGVDTITGFTVAADFLNFDNMTGISGDGVVFAAGDAKVGDAIDGEIYLFEDEDLTGVDVSFDFNGADDDAGLGSSEVLTSAAAYLEAALTETSGESYVALINTDNGGTDLYAAYLVSADGDGIDAADLTLLGSIASDTVLTATEIV